MATAVHRPLTFQDLWHSDAPGYVTIVTTGGTRIAGTLYGVTEGGRARRGEVLVQEHGPHREPTHITTDRIRAIWPGHGPR